jgi:hypothetical protein
MDSRYRYLRLCVGLCIACLVIVACKNRNRELDWNGSWKLNMSRSQAHGSYFTVGIAPNGVVTVTNEANSFNFQCNKKEFQNGAGHTTGCTPVNGGEWILKRRINGKVTGTFVWDISSDNETFVIRTTELRSDGTQGTSETTFDRRGGTNGFAGRWQEATPLKLRPKILDVAVDGQRLHLEYPESGQYSDSPLDGSVVPIHGMHVRPGSAISVKAISPQEFQTQLMWSGQVIRKGTLVIGEDGRTLLQESWVPENPDEKDRLVYDKQ